VSFQKCFFFLDSQRISVSFPFLIHVVNVFTLRLFKHSKKDFQIQISNSVTNNVFTLRYGILNIQKRLLRLEIWLTQHYNDIKYKKPATVMSKRIG